MTIEVGTKIWRPVIMNTQQGARIDQPDFDESDPDFAIVRATKSRIFCTKRDEWVVISASFNRGMVCFCQGRIPEDWTYFEVIKVNSGGKSCVVRPVIGLITELFDQYRMELVGGKIEK